MSFDDRNLRKGYSPKNNVNKKYNCKCKKENNLFFIILNDKIICSEKSAFEAWRTAEAILL